MHAPPTSLELLNGLCEQARAPHAGQEEFDALIAALSQPLAPGEAIAERAELLRLIAGDDFLGGFRGTQGQRVDEAANHALVAMGQPTVSRPAPPAVERPRPAPPPVEDVDTPPARDFSPVWRIARWLAFGSGLLVVGFISWFAALILEVFGVMVLAVGLSILTVVHVQWLALLKASSSGGVLLFFVHWFINALFVAGLGVVYFLIFYVVASGQFGKDRPSEALASVFMLDLGWRVLLWPTVFVRKLLA